MTTPPPPDGLYLNGDPFPAADDTADTDRVLLEHLRAGRTVDLRDVAGRATTVVAGRGITVAQVTGTTGVAVAVVYTPHHARLMSRLWALVAQVAEERADRTGVSVSFTTGEPVR